MSAVLQRKVSAAGQTATEVVAMERGGGEEGASWKAMEGFWEVNNFCGMWEYFILKRGRSKEHSSGYAALKNKKESKVSCNRSLHSKTFWNKSREVRIQTAVSGDAPCLHRSEGRVFKEENRKEGKLWRVDL